MFQLLPTDIFTLIIKQLRRARAPRLPLAGLDPKRV